MLCDKCRTQLKCGAVMTDGGNEIDYSECDECGIVEVMGMDVNTNL